MKGGKWDIPIDHDLREEEIQFFIDLFKSEIIRFPRCIKPHENLGKHSLIVFSDGSETAFGAIA